MFPNILLCILILINKQVVTIATATTLCIYHTWRERYKQTSICHSWLNSYVFLMYIWVFLCKTALSVGKLTSNFHLCRWLSLGLDKKKNNYPMPTSEGYVGSYRELCKLFLGQEHAQSCLTLCDPVNCSPPGSFVHGVFQGRILEWVGCHFLLQGIFPAQGSNLRLLCLLHWQVDSFTTAPPGKAPFLGHSISLISHSLV